MKLTALIGLFLIAAACTTETPEAPKKKVNEPENLIEFEDGIYTEYYPGKKKVKMRGAQDEKKVRDGKWVLLSESGAELSVTYFEKGLREGYTVVKHPNGAVNYVGAYLHDEMVGVWKFYDESGKLIREKDYGKGAK